VFTPAHRKPGNSKGYGGRRGEEKDGLKSSQSAHWNS